MRPLALAALLVLLGSGWPGGIEARSARTVTIGGDPELDACATWGKVARLGPRRAEDPKSGFLSVRSGPGGAAFTEIDQLHNGDEVIVCEIVGPWYGVLYPNRGQSFDVCAREVATTVARKTPYRGACRSGWIHRNYVEITAG